MFKYFQSKSEMIDLNLTTYIYVDNYNKRRRHDFTITKPRTNQLKRAHN